MIVKRVKAAGEALLDPRSPSWAGVAEEEIKLTATPLANQPSEYIKASRDERKIGKVRRIWVRAAHDGTRIFFRLSWEDTSKNERIVDTNIFPDGTGILFPVRGDPPIQEMGKKDNPVNAWFWRADFQDKPKNVWAEGLGTTEYSAKSPLEARSAWADGRWSVVLARPLRVDLPPDQAVELAPGAKTKVGFAVWEGSNGERGGIKSFSKEWRELVLEA